MKKMLFVALLAAVPASAQAMDVKTFLTKADGLKKKGMMALFSGDLKVLKSEIQTSASALKTERNAAKAAGRPQTYCPPEKGSLTSNEILASFQSIPEPQRPRIQVKDALKALLVKKYPCG